MESHQTHFQRAVCFFHQGQLSEALDSLNQCINQAPTMALAHNNLAVVYEHMQKPEEAESSLRTALSLNPRNYLFYFNSSSLCLRQEQPTKALSLINQAISAQLTVLGRIKSDEKLIKQALQLCPNNLEASFILSMLRVSSQDYSGAIKILQKSKEYHPKIPLINTLLRLARQLHLSQSLELEEQFYQSLEYGTFQKQVLICAQLPQMSEEQVTESVARGFKQFNSLYEQINMLKGHHAQYIEVKNEAQNVSSNMDQTRPPSMFFQPAVTVQ